jgi:hypothetical protein
MSNRRSPNLQIHEGSGFPTGLVLVILAALLLLSIFTGDNCGHAWIEHVMPPHGIPLPPCNR